MNTDYILEQAALTMQAYQKGMEMGARFERAKFEVVIKQYDLAMQDKSVVIPTRLMLAIEHARSELAKQNIAADAGIQRDKAERHTGRPEHDLDACGRRLEAGSP